MASGSALPPPPPPNQLALPGAIDPALLDPATLPVRRLKPTYRISVSPSYAARVQCRDDAQISQAESAKSEARFKQQNCHTVQLDLWVEVIMLRALSTWCSSPSAQNGAPPEGFVLRVPNWPGFHPKDCPELVEDYHLDTETCQYWEPDRRRWLNCTPHTPPRNIKNLETLSYRLKGVTEGIHMPLEAYARSTSSSPNKRPLAASLAEDDDAW